MAASASRLLGTRLRDVVPPLVECGWLAARQPCSEVRVLDASWYLPTAGRNPREEFSRAHLPGARFFDLDRVPDHMLPTAAEFAAWATELGVQNDSHVVLYDTAGSSFSAPRAWWTFRAFGHERVSVLQGGMNRWAALGQPLEALDKHTQLETTTAPPAPGSGYRERPLCRELVYDYEQIMQLVRANSTRSDSHTTPSTESDRTSGRPVVVDARSAGRFTGAEPEPRPGLSSGHMPGARSLPFSELRTTEAIPNTHAPQEYEVLKPLPELEATLARVLGADFRQRAWVASCGSGLTAAVVAFALHLAGAPVPPLYDGSWTEYAQQPSAVIHKSR
jgi:thiosulfate/3-mercaptopyruvate sulfurtransferase